MTSAFIVFVIISTLAQLVFARGKCTLVKGAYGHDEGVLMGCRYIYSIEFCPYHRYETTEQLNSITVELKSNMTKDGFLSTCALHNKVFSSVVREDFKRAVTATKTLNMTTMEGTFRSSMLYSVADVVNANASIMLFSLHNNHNHHERAFYAPITVNFRADRNTGAVSFVGPFHNVSEAPVVVENALPSHHVASEEKRTSERTKCDFNKLLSGQWNFDVTSKTWHWKTHTCDAELITVEAFVDWCKKYELKSLLLFGSSRTRTMMYDILLFIGYTLEEVKPELKHQHFTYHVQDKLNYDLTIHLHWDDNRPDTGRGGKQTSYTNLMTDMKTHFAEMNICTHHSNVPFNSEGGYYRGSNVDYKTEENKRYADASQPYAVIFTIGVYEAWLTGVDTFKALGPSLVQFVYESCMGAIPESSGRRLLDGGTATTDKNLFFVRLEEVVDPAIALHDSLNEVNDFMYRTIVPELNARLHARNMPPIMLLDSHHISRGWKLWRTDRDDIHYYNPEPGTFYGDHVSIAMGRIALQQVAQTMEERLRAEHGASTATAAVTASKEERQGVHAHTFPSYSALPEFHRDSVIPFEGRLLMSPHDHREMFLVHGGVKRPIPNWDTFLALHINIETMIYLSVDDFDAVPTGPSLPPAE